LLTEGWTHRTAFFTWGTLTDCALASERQNLGFDQVDAQAAYLFAMRY